MRVSRRRFAMDAEARAAAERAGLRYSSADEPGIARRRRGRGFVYRAANGKRPVDADALARIRSLAIPPAWRDVWICADPRGHLQAVGHDARGRKQYRYHPRWRQVRDAAKYDRLAAFCRALPRLRRRVASDLDCDCLCKEKMVALVVSLIERTQLRIGNDEYARANDSYGATTLRDRHVRVRGEAIELCFRGKGGKENRVRLRDSRLAATVRRSRALPGERLFQYMDRRGRPVPVTSADVNEYVRQVTGGPFTAKDFRTWAATMVCATLLGCRRPGSSQTARKRELKLTVAAVAEQLGNTPAVCRNSYIHPAVMDAYLEGRVPHTLARAARRLQRALRDDRGGGEESAASLDASSLSRIEGTVRSYIEKASRSARS